MRAMASAKTWTFVVLSLPLVAMPRMASAQNGGDFFGGIGQIIQGAQGRDIGDGYRSGPDLGQILIGGGNVVGSFRPNPRQPAQDYYEDGDGYYSAPTYRQPQPTYYPAQSYAAPNPPVSVAPKPNVRPRETALKPRGNSLNVMPYSLDTQATQAAQQSVSRNGQEKINEIEKELGATAQDPKVKVILDEGRTKINSGQPLDEKWATDLANAATAASTASKTTIANPEKLNILADDTIGLSQANAVLVNALNSAGTDPGLPSGQTSVVTMPSLDEEDTYLLPDGSVMVGTGGEGQVGVVSADASEVLGMPIGSGIPEPESMRKVEDRVKSGIYLLNPASNDSTINYTIDGAAYSMASGFTQRLPEGKQWVIRFDRGSGGDEGKYTLNDGSYAFGATEKGWELYRKSFSLTIDNTGNDSAFNYNLNNKAQEVAAGQTKTHTGDYPIFVQFDRGNGSVSKKVVDESKQVLSVAVNPTDSLWDLYPADEVIETSKSNAVAEKMPAKKKLKGSERVRLLNKLSKLQ